MFDSIRSLGFTAILTTTMLTTAMMFGTNSGCYGHPGEEHSHAHDEHGATTDGQQTTTLQMPKGMVLPSLEGPRPWSDKPVLNDPMRFQIAIMTDRMGGHRPGVWMDAVRKLNRLRPEFVMSVGDLIQGYSNDRNLLQSQWKEFISFIDQLEMRFFFVTGNHDVTNPLAHELWREHFGPEWYSFDYKKVHFLCLASEDPHDCLSKKQVAWAKQDLAEHADARWTLVFMHKPLWKYAERDLAAGNPDSTRWKQVEKILAPRPHTVFVGHEHHYVQYDRNGQQYIILATTGGGSQMRGVEYGEFDHVMWLTMESDGPHLINLTLDGMLAPNVITEESAKRFKAFLTQTGIEVEPILIKDSADASFSSGEIVVRLRNEFNEPIEMTGVIEGLPLRGLTVDPAKLKLAAKPKEATELRVQVKFSEPMTFERLARTSLTAMVRTKGENPLSAERVTPVVIDRRFAFPVLASMPEIDGVIEDWPDGLANRAQSIPKQPLLLGAVQNWNGPGDCDAQFFARRVGDRVYVAVRVTDDRVLASDRVQILVDPRPTKQRVHNPDYVQRGFATSVHAPDAQGKTKVTARKFRGAPNKRDYRGVAGKSKRTESGYDVEFDIPLTAVQQLQGSKWKSFQATLVLHDSDDSEERPVQIVWRGTQRLREVNTGFGHFIRE